MTKKRFNFRAFVPSLSSLFLNFSPSQLLYFPLFILSKFLNPSIPASLLSSVLAPSPHLPLAPSPSHPISFFLSSIPEFLNSSNPSILTVIASESSSAAISLTQRTVQPGLTHLQTDPLPSGHAKNSSEATTDFFSTSSAPGIIPFPLTDLPGFPFPA